MCTNPRPRRLLLITSACALLLVGWAAGAHSDHGCDGCHVPHNASALPGLPLWNGNETVTNPDGSTSTVHHGPELCRMCHLK